jgi:hypothetical protein
VIDGVRGIHRLDHKAITHTESLIWWLELSAEVGVPAITAADTIEVAEEFAALLVMQR